MQEKMYKTLRKLSGMTREEVCSYVMENNMGVLTVERLERIENGRFNATAEEILLLAEVYKKPSLCNHYCSHECDIGKKYVPRIHHSELAKIILSTIASLNNMKSKEELLIEIASDGKINNEELEDFIRIQEELEKISVNIESLQLWTEQMIAEGKIDAEKYKKLKK